MGMTLDWSILPAFRIACEVCLSLCIIYDSCYSLFCSYLICQMEKNTGQAASPTCTDLENILKGLDSMSNCMDQLACMYYYLSLSNVFMPEEL